MELERLLAALRRRWWLLALLGLIGALVGQFSENSRDDLFTATATIAIAPDLDVFGSETVLNRIVINEMGRIGSDALRDEVLASLGNSGNALDANRDFSLQQVPDTDLVNVSVSSGDPNLSVAAANRWAERYVDCLLYTSPSPRDRTRSRMPSSA